MFIIKEKARLKNMSKIKNKGSYKHRNKNMKATEKKKTILYILFLIQKTAFLQVFTRLLQFLKIVL